MRGGMRRATVADAAAVARIHVETWRTTYAGILPDAYLVGMQRSRHASYWHRMIASDRGARLTLVMEEPDAGIVGFASGGPARRAGLPRGGATKGEIYTLYVGDNWQGRGYGRALFHGAAASLFEAGLGGIVVWVLDANPSRFFYEAMGGVRFATRRELFAGVELAEIAYAWLEAPGGR